MSVSNCKYHITFCFQVAALPEIIEAVNGKVEVYLDGGVRQGTDAFKALAIGAKAVFVGRPALWGLSYDVSIFCFFHIHSSLIKKQLYDTSRSLL